MRRFLFLLSLLTALGLFADTPEVEETKMHWGSLTMYAENDKFFAGTDEHYTNGFKLTAVSRDLTPDLGEAPAWARAIARQLPTHGSDRPGRKLGFAIGQNIYTPGDVDTSILITNDRPYAAWLYGSLAVHAQSEKRLDVFEISLGVVGPSALGREIQNGWHKIIDVDQVQGWDNQLHDEPGLILAFEHRLRYVSDSAATGWGTDFIPYAGFSVGNVATYLSGGAQVRFGWRLPSDFGSALIRPGGASSTHESGDLKGWSMHAFAGIDSRLVGRDIFLDGNTWKSSHSVDRREIVADFMAGFSLRMGRLRATYSQVYRTKEFYGQADRDVFGSVALTILY